jgi:hypothetical protein
MGMTPYHQRLFCVPEAVLFNVTSFSLLEIIQNLLNLIRVNTNILEGIKQIDACISRRREGGITSARP